MQGWSRLKGAKFWSDASEMSELGRILLRFAIALFGRSPKWGRVLGYLWEFTLKPVTRFS